MNMKIKLLLSLILVGWVSALAAWEFPEFSLEGRVSYFYPVENRVRKIYQTGWADYQIQLDETFCGNWTLWQGFSYWKVKGRSTCLSDKTKMRMPSVRFGGQYQICVLPCLQLYAGGGATYNFVSIHDKSHFVNRHFNKNSFGGTIQTGLYYFFTNRLFINANFEYLFQRFGSHHPADRTHVEQRSLNLDGFKVGGGLGVTF
jgi:hypothetical protein